MSKRDCPEYYIKFGTYSNHHFFHQWLVSKLLSVASLQRIFILFVAFYALGR